MKMPLDGKDSGRQGPRVSENGQISKQKSSTAKNLMNFIEFLQCWEAIGDQN